MNIKEIHTQLEELYVEKNLNDIATYIIQNYKSKNYDNILSIAKTIESDINYNIKNINKLFAQLIMMYHPDRLNYYMKEIKNHYENNNIEKLKQYLHLIQIVNNLKQGEQSQERVFDFDFFSDIQWSYSADDFDTEIRINENYDSGYVSDTISCDTIVDFYTAYKIKEYGNLNIETDIFELKNIEGSLNMANMDIDDLDGIEHCKNLVSLDLSNNNIPDISILRNLRLLEQLYIGNNSIDSINCLEDLKFLKTLDISQNKINDITPLITLTDLKFLNLLGNDIPEDQILKLQEYGIMIVY